MWLKVLLFYFFMCWASFFMLVGEHLVTNQPLLQSRSCCNYCKHTIPFIFLLPIIGPCLTCFKCPKCQQQIPLYYSLGELFYALTCYMITFLSSTRLLDYWIFSLLFIMACSDYHQQWIPNRLQFLLLVAVLSITTYSHLPLYWWVAGYGILLFISLFYLYPQGIGGGDVKAILCLLCAYPPTLCISWLLTSCIIAIFWIAYHSLMKKQIYYGVPLLPFIVISFPIIFIL